MDDTENEMTIFLWNISDMRLGLATLSLICIPLATAHLGQPMHGWKSTFIRRANILLG
jgi:hypothetical protein